MLLSADVVKKKKHSQKGFKILKSIGTVARFDDLSRAKEPAREHGIFGYLCSAGLGLATEG